MPYNMIRTHDGEASRFYEVLCDGQQIGVINELKEVRGKCAAYLENDETRESERIEGPFCNCTAAFNAVIESHLSVLGYLLLCKNGK